MRAVVQRVKDCTVTVGTETVGAIAAGLLVYVGFESDDSDPDIRFLADKLVNLRIFPDSEGKMNLSVKEIAERILVVSQFTLHADARKGRRPSYNRAAPPDRAKALYTAFLAELERLDIHPEQGRFGASMEVRYTNQGPVTILLDSKKEF